MKNVMLKLGVLMLLLVCFGCDGRPDKPDKCEQMKAEILCEVKGHVLRFKLIKPKGRDSNYYVKGGFYGVDFDCCRCGEIQRRTIWEPHPWRCGDPNSAEVKKEDAEYKKSDYYILNNIIRRAEK